jgi:hypothetical protein
MCFTDKNFLDGSSPSKPVSHKMASSSKPSPSLRKSKARAKNPSCDTQSSERIGYKETHATTSDRKASSLTAQAMRNHTAKASNTTKMAIKRRNSSVQMSSCKNHVAMSMALAGMAVMGFSGAGAGACGGGCGC